MTSNEFKEFLFRRPAIDLRRFAEDAGVATSTIENLAKGRSKPTQRTLDKLEQTAARYGLYWPNATPIRNRKIR